jgi:PHD/YefM family antitoxin component YafN of YafNO toxin-antitoxin module
MSKNVRFVVDGEGHKTAVILPIEDYEEMMEELHLAQATRDSKDERRRPFSEVVDEMRAAEEIDA